MYFILFLFIFILSPGSNNNVIITNVDVESLQLGSAPPSKNPILAFCVKTVSHWKFLGIFSNKSECAIKSLCRNWGHINN